MAPAAPPSDRTALHRLPERGHHDRATIDAILDEALICHLGLVDPEGRPFVIPTIHARAGDHLYVHGSPASRALRAGAKGIPACVTVTLLDGLVLARSAFHHSMNYRSVVVFGRAATVTDTDERDRALRAVVDHMVAGRSDACRTPTPEELRATRVLRVPLAEASAKIRTGPPKEDAADLDPPVWWGGVVPVTTVLGEPQPDAHC